MTPPWLVYTAPRFDRLLHKLLGRHPDLVDRYATVLTILETDPQNQTGTHNIKKLQGDRYPTRSGRWRFIYEIVGRDVVLTYCGLRREDNVSDALMTPTNTSVR